MNDKMLSKEAIASAVEKAPAEAALVLQLAVQGLDIPHPVESARAFVEHCRAMWNTF